MEISRDEGSTPQVLKKYNQIRKKKLQSSRKPWEGPSHKKFSNYFDKDSDSEEDEEETVKDSPDGKENWPKPTAEQSGGGEASTTEAMESDDSDQSDALILPATAVLQEKPRNFALSDSEPEDPEETRRFQQMLEARRNRARSQNLSTVSVARNRTINLNRTKNATIVRGLLELSSSSDEGDAPPVNFVMKAGDDDDFEEADPATPPEKKIKRRSSQKTVPSSRTTPLVSRIPPPPPPAAASSEDEAVVEVPMPQASSPEPPRFRRQPDEPPVQDQRPLPADEEIAETPPTPEVALPIRAPRPSRISTPKPTDLKAGKLLNNKVRRSKIPATVDKTPEAPAKPKGRKSLMTPPQPSPSSLTKAVARKSATTPLATPPSSAKASAKKSAPPSPPSSAARTRRVSLTAQRLAAASERRGVDETASPTKFFKSKTRRSGVSAPPPPQPSPPPPDADVEAPASQPVDVYDALPVAAVEEQQVEEQAEPEAPLVAKPRRRTRASLGRRSNGPAGDKKSFQESGRAAAPPPPPPPPPAAAGAAEGPVQPTGSPAATATATATATAGVKEAEDSTVAQSPAPLAGGGACGGVAFESQHRPADALDPVQSCLIHRSAACHTVLWKLLPAASNLSRSRADTCVLVYEGSICVDGVEYPRGNVLKLPADRTYLVSNSSAGTAAVYQVTEYL